MTPEEYEGEQTDPRCSCGESGSHMCPEEAVKTLERYNPLKRFLTQLDVRGGPDGCWLWRGGKNTMGYGRFRYAGKKSFLAHRFAYMLGVGPLHGGMLLDHACRVHACVRPSHLRLATDRQNLFAPDSRSPAKANLLKTHCPKGHPYDKENTLLRPRGWRHCRACRRERNHQSRSTVKALQGGKR